MNYFIEQLINGLSLGSIYALVALGYTMVYGIIKLINFAHGEILMLGAFLGYYFMRHMQLNFGLAIICAMIACAVIGVTIEFLAYRPLRKAPRIAALITAIGVSFFLQNIMIYFFSADPRPYPQAVKQKSFELFGGITITNIQLIIIGVSLFFMVLLQLIVRKTRMGKAMRAVSVDPDAAQLMGISVNRTISFTFALGSALAAVGGVLVAMKYNSIDPMMGVTPGLKAFIAAVVGGIGLIPGAALGGYAIGLIETAVVALGFSGYKDAVVYLILILILLIRPSGILGKNVKEKV